MRDDHLMIRPIKHQWTQFSRHSRWFCCLLLPAGGENFGAYIAACLGPFVILLGDNGADKTQDGTAEREDARHIGTPADSAIEVLLNRPSWLGSSRGAGMLAVWPAEVNR
jgi:hypothetical protein